MNESLERYERNVEWLKQNLSEDEIYRFAEQGLMAAEFFLSKWNEWVDILEEAEKDKMVKLWIQNLTTIRLGQNAGIPTKITTRFKEDT